MEAGTLPKKYSLSAPPMNQNNKTPSSDSARKPIEMCKPDNRGRCLKHECDIKKFGVTSKEWVDRGGGKGYGYKHFKVTKYICMSSERNTDGPSVENNPGVGNLSDGYRNSSEQFERESFSQRTIDGDLIGIQTDTL